MSNPSDPRGPFLYSSPVKMPQIGNTDFLFGVRIHNVTISPLYMSTTLLTCCEYWENGDYPRTTPVGFYNGSLRNKSDYNWPAQAETYQTRDGSKIGWLRLTGNLCRRSTGLLWPGPGECAFVPHPDRKRNGRCHIDRKWHIGEYCYGQYQMRIAG